MTSSSDASPDRPIPGLAKIGRAFEIRDELRDLLEDLLTTTPGDYRRRDNLSDHASPTVWAEWMLGKSPDYRRASLLMGDMIHNLRAAMDHAIWAITPQSVQETRPTEVAFPLLTSRAAFNKWLSKRKTWYGPTVTAALEAYQPFHAGTEMLHPLHVLQFLSNTDKHRVLNIVASSAVSATEVDVRPPPLGGARSTLHDGVVTSDSVLARVEFARPLEGGEIEFTPTFAFHQVLRYVDPQKTERWLPLGDAMNAVCPAVVETVGYLASAHERDTASSAESKS